MYSLTHLGLNLVAAGATARLQRRSTKPAPLAEVWRYPMLARATAMAAGLHLTLFDFEGAEALQSEACELARGADLCHQLSAPGLTHY